MNFEKRITVRISKKQRQEIESRCNKLKISLSAVVRYLIDNMQMIQIEDRKRL